MMLLRQLLTCVSNDNKRVVTFDVESPESAVAFANDLLGEGNWYIRDYRQEYDR